jgi:nitroreductase
MLNSHSHKEIEKAVIRSQHTQRNWDLNKQIPKEDIKTLLHAVTNCPSKQNVAFYKIHFIQDRDIIEEIHENTYGFGTFKGRKGASYDTSEVRETETNPQTLANLLVIFEDYNYLNDLDGDIHRNQATREYVMHGKLSVDRQAELDRDKQIAVGIASGYLNLTASLMGYKTGCCQCMDQKAIQHVALLEEKPLLLMGVGFPQEGVSRRQHHVRDFNFISKKKQPIKYKIWD